MSRSRRTELVHGPTCSKRLDQVEAHRRPTEQPLRFCVQDVYRFDERRIIAGRIESGRLRAGDELVFSPANKLSIVASIEGSAREEAIAGDSIGITLREQIFVERGYVASHEKDRPIETNRFRADIFWLAETPLRKDEQYSLRLATQEVKCQVVAIEQVMDSSSLTVLPNETNASFAESGRPSHAANARAARD